MVKPEPNSRCPCCEVVLELCIFYRHTTVCSSETTNCWTPSRKKRKKKTKKSRKKKKKNVSAFEVVLSVNMLPRSLQIMEKTASCYVFCFGFLMCKRRSWQVACVVGGSVDTL